MRVFLYFCCSALMFFFAVGVKGKKKITDIILMGLISSIPAIFSIFLPYAISDRAVYANRFLNFYPLAYMNDIGAIFKQTSVEYGFALYNLFLYKIMPDAKFFFFVSSFIANFCLLWAFYKMKKYTFYKMVLIYLCTWYPFLSFYLIRQILAIGFVAIGMAEYINADDLKKCWKKTFFWFMLGMLFHGTAIVAIIWIVLCEVIKGKKSINRLFVLLALGVVLMWPILNWVLNWTVFQNKFLGSRTVQTISVEVFMKGAPMLLAAVLGVLYRNRLYLKEPKIDRYIIGSLFFGFMWIYAINSYWVFRFSFYGIFLFCGLMSILKKWLLNQKFAKYIYILVIFISTVIFYRELILYMNLVFIE